MAYLEAENDVSEGESMENEGIVVVRSSTPTSEPFFDSFCSFFLAMEVVFSMGGPEYDSARMLLSTLDRKVQRSRIEEPTVMRTLALDRKR
jgi:Golgi nucleoside diphosphatase